MRMTEKLCLTKMLGITPYYKFQKALVWATYWIDTDSGEQVKLTHNIKSVYFHLLDQYKSFANLGKVYHESHQTIANKLGLNIKTVQDVAIPLLKRMGLVAVLKIAHKKYNTVVFPLDHLNGKLDNPHVKESPFKKKKISYEDKKIIDKNYQQINKIKNDIDKEFVVITKEDFERLRQKPQD